MTCKEAESLVMPYIRHELDVGQMEEFLEHIDHLLKAGDLQGAADHHTPLRGGYADGHEFGGDADSAGQDLVADRDLLKPGIRMLGKNRDRPVDV